ncbi:hypothetical protein CSUI_004050 [Cystoisospora suis]|uniref:Uncharacterized protein n=1 Tax=Cystoisospora suis TaxID=483139 RepID=A0A2C6KDF2_9APIC|nr:hypothetical protein CSUI_004050 [Cystoisospora suis]
MGAWRPCLVQRQPRPRALPLLCFHSLDRKNCSPCLGVICVFRRRPCLFLFSNQRVRLVITSRRLAFELFGL